MGDSDNYPHVTPIPPSADQTQLWKTLDKITSAVNRTARHTDKIPDIQKKVDSTGAKVIELSTEMRGMSVRVTKIENKVDRPHDCYQVDVIAEVKADQKDNSGRMLADNSASIEHRAKLDAAMQDISNLTGEVNVIKSGPRRMVYGLIGVILTILMSVGGLVWFLAELNKDVEFERTQRTEQLRHIELQSKQRSKAIHSDLDELSHAVRVSVVRDDEFDLMCDGMRSSEKRLLRVTLKRRGRRVPPSCLE